MPAALRYLVLSSLLALILTFAAAVAKRLQEPRHWGAGARDTPPPDYTGLAGRLNRAAANMLETFPIFAVLVVVGKLVNADGAQTALGAQLYFWSRLFYVPAYAFGIPYIRTLFYLVSLAGLFVLFRALL